MFTAALSALLAMLLLLSLSTPAQARDLFLSRTSGRTATADWTQVDGTKRGTPFGNVHVGSLQAFETRTGKAEVFGYISDFDCKPGQLPDHGGGHGFIDEPTTPSGCKYVGDRFIEGGNLAFTIDRKLSTATLNGQVQVYGGGHGDGSVLGAPPVNMKWTGYGTLARERFTYRFSDGTTSSVESFRSSYRQATVTGNIGPMGFAPDLSGGSLTQFKNFSSARGR